MCWVHAASRIGPFPKGQVSFGIVSVTMRDKAEGLSKRPSTQPTYEMLMQKRQTVVAIVDDDADMLRAAEDLLNAHGFASEGFLSAEEFVRRETANQVDCLLLDIQLGGMSGIELRHRLNVSCPRLPVIYMTSHDDELTRRKALEAGCNAYLRKPFPAKHLIEAIESALR